MSGNSLSANSNSSEKLSRSENNFNEKKVEEKDDVIKILETVAEDIDRLKSQNMRNCKDGGCILKERNDPSVCANCSDNLLQNLENHSNSTDNHLDGKDSVGSMTKLDQQKPTANHFENHTVAPTDQNISKLQNHSVSSEDAEFIQSHEDDNIGMNNEHLKELLQKKSPSICYSEFKIPVTKNHSRRTSTFYERQNKQISTYEEVHAGFTEDGDNTSDGEEKRTLKLATKMSKITFTCNLLLFLAKLVAAILSGSLVIISSLLDSAMDLVSGVLMWWSNRAIKNTNYNLYPRGRRKLEPVAIVVLAVIMSFVSVQLIHESIQKMVIYCKQTYERDLGKVIQWKNSFNISQSIDDSDWLSNGLVNITERDVLEQSISSLAQLVKDCSAGHAAPVFEIPTIIICVATIIVKLILYLVCRRIDNPSVQALAKDHFNDVISNSGAIACGLIGYKLWKYADPIGAILISLWIIINWSITAHSQIRMLTGYTAEPGFIKKVTWIVINHDDRIRLIDSVIAFHFGNKFLVEVKVVLPGELSMRESHDLCEALQKKIERLPEVERAFIHIDYQCDYYTSSGSRKISKEANTLNSNVEIITENGHAKIS